MDYKEQKESKHDPWSHKGYAVGEPATATNPDGLCEGSVYMDGEDITVMYSVQSHKGKVHITWDVPLQGTVHVIELHHGTFWGNRKVLIDGEVRIRGRKFLDSGDTYRFREFDSLIEVRIVARTTGFVYELWVNDSKVENVDNVNKLQSRV